MITLFLTFAGCLSLSSLPGIQTSTGGSQSSSPPAGNASADTHCCVNKAYYQCASVAQVRECVGEPMTLMSCVQGCGFGDSSCEERCMSEHGPDTGVCERQPDRDAQCT